MSLERELSQQMEGIDRQDPRVLTQVSFNVGLGKNLGELVEQFESAEVFAGVDVIALQEASEHSWRGDYQPVKDAHRLAGVLQERNGRTYDTYQFGITKVHGVVQANAIIWDADRIADARISKIHLPPFAKENRSKGEKAAFRFRKKQFKNGIVLEATFKNKPIRIYSAHTDLDGFDPHRSKQVEHILLDNKSRDEDPKRPKAVAFIFLDMNTWRIPIIYRPTWSQVQSVIDRHGFSDASEGLAPTFFTLGIGQHLDRVLYQQDRAIVKARVLNEVTGSDHHGIVTYAIVK